MANLPGPYELEYELNGWTAPVRAHVFRINCIAVGNPAAGSPATGIDIQKQNGTTAKLNVVANQLWEYLRLFYNSSIVAAGYTLWKYMPGTLAKDFITSATLTNPACSGTVGINSHQQTLSFRSANGGIMKLVILEGNSGGNTQTTLTANAAGTSPQKLAAYILSADNIAISRDDAFIVAPLRDSRGENEKIFRLINR